MKTYDIPGIFGISDIVWFCGENEAIEKQKCEVTTPPPPGGSRKWSADLTDLTKMIPIPQSCTMNAPMGYVGTCTAFSPSGVLLECDLPDP